MEQFFIFSWGNACLWVISLLGVFIGICRLLEAFINGYPDEAPTLNPFCWSFEYSLRWMQVSNRLAYVIGWILIVVYAIFFCSGILEGFYVFVFGAILWHGGIYFTSIACFAVMLILGLLGIVGGWIFSKD
ncbi:MAG: hypothetical protein IJ689_04030 [Alphaproteobacteria bacterium]|nr:hypothetical protein [Alphaproteobacteria bacterium]